MATETGSKIELPAGYVYSHITKIPGVCGGRPCRWTIRGPGGAAERLGLHPSTLYFRMKKLSIQRPR